MGKLTIAFDVDDTLIIPSVATNFGQDTPNFDTIDVFKWFQAQGHHMIIWSGSGMDYAKCWADRLGLEAEIRVKALYDDVDIAFDDMSSALLGKVNVTVCRINNSVSRKDWNRKERP